MTLQQRWQLSVECVLVLFFCSAGPGAFQVWQNGAESAGAYWMIIGVPLTAGAALLTISMLIPGLLAVGSMKFPLQLTLPLVYSSLVLVSATMWTTTPEELMSNFEVIRYARVWQQPGELLLSTAIEIIGMLLLTLLRRV